MCIKSASVLGPRPPARVLCKNKVERAERGEALGVATLIRPQGKTRQQVRLEAGDRAL